MSSSSSSTTGGTTRDSVNAAAVFRALANTRAGGAVVPKKVSNQYIIVPEIEVEEEPVVETTTTRLWYIYAGPSSGWRQLVTSTDDTIITYCLADYGYIYVSIDAGETFTQYVTGLTTLSSFAANRNATILMAGDGMNTVVSRNSGITWDGIHIGGSALYTNVDGTTLVSGSLTGSLYYSDDSGISWTESTNATIGGWSDVAGTSDGTIIYVANNTETNGGLWKRYTIGGGFTKLEIPNMESCETVWCNASGSEIWAANTKGKIFRSTSNGILWTTPVTNANGREIKQIRAGTEPVNMLYVLTEKTMYVLPAPFTELTRMRFPTFTAITQNSITITGIFVDTENDMFASYTISNGYTTSALQTSTSYMDTFLSSGTTYNYTLTYYSPEGVAQATFDLSNTTTLS